MKRFVLLFAVLSIMTITVTAQVKVDLSGSSNEIPLKKNALTIGVLNGGGALVGVDYERLIQNKLGIQVGAGWLAYGFGLNYHFKPTVQSSFLNFGYWHQGIGDRYAQSVVGVSYVFRAKKLLQAQLGGGFQVDYNASLMVQQPFMLMYAIGIYLPY